MKRLTRPILVVLASFFLGKTAVCAQPYDFQNTKLKDDKRVELFLQQLTLDEKMMWLSPMMGTPRLGTPMMGCYEGLHGLALGGPSRHNGVKTVDGKEVPNDLPTTIFPQAYGMGCTWDRDLIRRIGTVEAEETRWYAQGTKARRKGLVVFAPNADLARDPRWGRTEESFGEDPYLTAQLSVAMVRGLQIRIIVMGIDKHGVGTAIGTDDTVVAPFLPGDLVKTGMHTHGDAVPAVV